MDHRARAAALFLAAACQGAAMRVEPPHHSGPPPSHCGLGYKSTYGHLVDRKHKLIMGWTPRAACTGAVTMFLQNAGLYGPQDQANFPFVHGYRTSLGWSIIPTAAEMEDPSFTKFKVVRNPFARAVSVWVAVMESNFHDNPNSLTLAASAWGAQYNISDKRFVDWLELARKVGLNNEKWDDPHVHTQVSGWELAGGHFDYVCRLENDFQSCLDEIKKRTGSSLTWEDGHVSHSVQQPASLDSAYVKWGELNHEGVTPHPDLPTFYKHEEVVKEVYDIYRLDFERYGYPAQFEAS